jgi:hypothetical protein
MVNRKDNAMQGAESLEAVKKLLAATGTDVSRIIVDPSGL